jgi:predicted RNase H-like HicB family nuclease
MVAVRTFSLREYIARALELAQYELDENDVVIASVPNASGFFAQGDTFEQARLELADAIEGNVILALQLGLPIAKLPGVDIIESER